jgi:4'-phosphopantetheinyl transferase
MRRAKFPGADEVHVRFARLDREECEQSELERHLSTEELARADRLKFELARNRFVAGRAFVRETLASYLGVAAEDIVLGKGEWGKPHLAQEMGSANLSFNLSHAAGLAVLAVSLKREVGIDMERMTKDLPYRDIARMFFSSREKEELFSLPQQEQLDAFYRCWSRKEAYLKGCGRGFSETSDIFDVSLLPGDPPALIEHRQSPGEPARWSLIDIPVPHGFCAALAVEGRPPVIRSFPMD